MATHVPPSMTDVYMPAFREAAGAGAELEIRLRLLAGLILPGGKLGIEQNLSELVEQILKRFASVFSADESQFLTSAVQLRNKMLHADFQAALKKISALRPGTLRPGGVHVLNLTTGIGKRVAEATKREPGVYGWFMEAANNGSFQQAAGVFNDAVDLVKRTAWEQSKPKG